MFKGVLTGACYRKFTTFLPCCPLLFRLSWFALSCCLLPWSVASRVNWVAFCRDKPCFTLKKTVWNSFLLRWHTKHHKSFDTNNIWHICTDDIMDRRSDLTHIWGQEWLQQVEDNYIPSYAVWLLFCYSWWYHLVSFVWAQCRWCAASVCLVNYWVLCQANCELEWICDTVAVWSCSTGSSMASVQGL